MKAYSLDFRQKIVDTYAEGNSSQRQLAERFRVALSFIEKLLKQDREPGAIAPKVRTDQTPTKLTAEQLDVLQQIVEANNDATLEELRQQLHQQTGVLIGRSTVDRMLQKLNLTVKNPARQRKRERTGATATGRVLATGSKDSCERPDLH